MAVRPIMIRKTTPISRTFPIQDLGRVAKGPATGLKVGERIIRSFSIFWERDRGQNQLSPSACPSEGTPVLITLVGRGGAGQPFDRRQPVRRMNGNRSAGTQASVKPASSETRAPRQDEGITPSLTRVIRSKCVFVIGGFDRTVPGTVEFLQHLFRRRMSGFDDTVQRLEVAGFVPSEMIDVAATAQAPMRQGQAFPRDFEHEAVPDFGLEAEPRHLVAQRLAFLRGPSLDDVPG